MQNLKKIYCWDKTVAPGVGSDLICMISFAKIVF